MTTAFATFRQWLAIGLLTLFPATMAMAEIDGHGPDAWRVSGVAANDVLNIRMGPGTQYPIISSFGPNERGLEQITCVPLMIGDSFATLTERERQALPARWCLMRSPDYARAGWVSARYLVEDSGSAVAPAARPGARGGAVTTFSTAPRAAPAPAPAVVVDGDDPIASGVALVRQLYTAHLNALGGENSPVWGATSRDYFFADLIPLLRNAGADPLLDAQDFEGQVTRIIPYPGQEMLRGTVVIVVDFVNFGANFQAHLYLRADPSLPGAPLRIFRIEHAEWTLP